MLTTTVTATRPASPPSATPPDGALPDGGPPIGPDQWVPQPGHMTFHELLSSLNPLQHLPVVGMIYRAVTGDTIPAPMQIAGSVISGLVWGGPAGVLGSIGLCLAEELFRMGPAVPGHTLKVGDYSNGSETPSPIPDGPPPSAIYADGSGGLPTWQPGVVSTWDLTKPANPAALTAADTAPRRAALAAYQQAMQTWSPTMGGS